jgi:hypothetical protein
MDRDKLYLLPLQGSDTQWYKNALKNSKLQITAGGVEDAFKAVPMTEHKGVSCVVDKFRDKYGASDVKKYIQSLTWRCWPSRSDDAHQKDRWYCAPNDYLSTIIPSRIELRCEPFQ